jgi:hypothetical protein
MEGPQVKKAIAIGILAIVGIVFSGVQADAAHFAITRFELSRINPPGRLEDGGTFHVLDTDIGTPIELQLVSAQGGSPMVPEPVTIVINEPEQAGNSISLSYRAEGPGAGIVTLTVNGALTNERIVIRLRSISETQVILSEPFELFVSTGPLAPPPPPPPEPPTTNGAWLHVPKSISLRHPDGSRVGDGGQLIIEAASREMIFYVEVDNLPGENNYDLYNISGGEVTEVLITGPGLTAHHITYYSSMVTQRSSDTVATTIARVSLSARNPGGTQGSPYDPIYSYFQFEWQFNFTHGGGNTAAERNIRTQEISVRIDPLDDGPDGSCSTLGLGILAFAVIPMLFLRKKPT